VFFRLSHLIKVRRRHAAFHPHGLQKVVFLAPEVFCLLRSAADGTEHVLCVHNLSDHVVSLENASLPKELQPHPRNLINGKFIRGKSILIEPYQTLWLATD
jgi:sucrose phosphorylase